MNTKTKINIKIKIGTDWFVMSVFIDSVQQVECDGMGLNENWGKWVVIICHSLVAFGRWKVTGMGLGMGMVVGMEVIVDQVPLERVSLFVSSLSMVTCILYI